MGAENPRYLAGEVLPQHCWKIQFIDRGSKEGCFFIQNRMITNYFLFLACCLSLSSGETPKFVTISEFWEDLRALPHLEITKEFTGPHLHPHYKDDKLHIHFKCPALFGALVSNESKASIWPPPQNIPPELKSGYTMGGAMRIIPFYFAEKQEGGAGYNWKRSEIEKWGSADCTCGWYKDRNCNDTILKHQQFIEGKKGSIRQYLFLSAVK